MLPPTNSVVADRPQCAGPFYSPEPWKDDVRLWPPVNMDISMDGFRIRYGLNLKADKEPRLVKNYDMASNLYHNGGDYYLIEDIHQDHPQAQPQLRFRCKPCGGKMASNKHLESQSHINAFEATYRADALALSQERARRADADEIPGISPPPGNLMLKSFPQRVCGVYRYVHGVSNMRLRASEHTAQPAAHVVHTDKRCPQLVNHDAGPKSEHK